MFTWILLAIIVAALLGYINVDKVRAKLIEWVHQYLPQVQKFLEDLKAKNAVAPQEEKKEEEKKDETK